MVPARLGWEEVWHVLIAEESRTGARRGVGECVIS